MIGKQTKRKVTERDKERDQEREGIYLCIPHTATLPLQRTLEIESPAKQCSNPTSTTTLTRAQTYRNGNTNAATTWRAVHPDSKGRGVKFFRPGRDPMLREKLEGFSGGGHVLCPLRRNLPSLPGPRPQADNKYAC